MARKSPTLSDTNSTMVDLSKIPKTTIDLRNTESVKIEFDSSYEVPIQTGNKRATIRIWDQPKVLEGDQFMAVTESGKTIGNYTVRNIELRTVEDIIEDGVDGHQDYDDFDHFEHVFSSFYPNAGIDEETEMYVIYW